MGFDFMVNRVNVNFTQNGWWKKIACLENSTA